MATEERKEKGGWGEALWSFVRGLTAVALFLALAGLTSYAVATWRLDTEGGRLKDTWEARWAEFQAAHTTSPEALTTEVAELKQALQDYRVAAEARLAALEGATKAAGEGPAQAAQVGRELNLRAALLKAESELTAARLELSAQNRGRASAELELADQTLEALSSTEWATAVKDQVEEILTVIRSARLDLAAGLPTAADRVNLAGHSLGVILAGLSAASGGAWTEMGTPAQPPAQGR